ncbi:hypothetical protein [Paractinoplanes lichenicola]|uniref:Uncharacterized protein n=1 Tax=Paractinoplanes lichenicola TaxID=2802976 RepID=A0ABS1VUB5_9ACTN|nr:hypothetical protein [Actinoplanes lichenicola]MBL7258040.1 hypothetical protein [Actinoplanes lichenicola]
MSSSPKYTTVVFEHERQAQFEAARLAREAERRRHEEIARRQRFEAGLRAARERAEALTARSADLARVATGLPQQPEAERQRDLTARIAAGIGGITDEAGLTAWNDRALEAERGSERLRGTVAAEMTTREHDAALGLTEARLDGETDRARLDPAGAERVAGLTAEARAQLGGPGFAPAHDRLGIAAAEHLERVADQRALLRRLAGESAEAELRLTAALAEAGEAAVDLPDAEAAHRVLADLKAEHDEVRPRRWEHLLDEARRRTADVTAAVEARLDQLERMAIIVEAAGAALPQAGLRVVAGSLVERDDAMTFRARRTDGTDIELTVRAGDGRGSRLEYRSEGADMVVEQTAEGTVARCDLTEEILERLHTELGHQGVRTDGLHWEGKPEGPRPDQEAIGNTAAGIRKQG